MVVFGRGEILEGCNDAAACKCSLSHHNKNDLPQQHKFSLCPKWHWKTSKRSSQNRRRPREGENDAETTGSRRSIDTTSITTIIEVRDTMILSMMMTATGRKDLDIQEMKTHPRAGIGIDIAGGVEVRGIGTKRRNQHHHDRILVH
jgi:hypothetical protein